MRRPASSPEWLAMQRELLLLEARVQRLRLAQDLADLHEAASPPALARQGWRRLAGALEGTPWAGRLGLLLALWRWWRRSSAA